MLRFIGNSLPARLTILIPFIGNLIIFNEFVQKSFTMPENIMRFGNIQYEINISAFLSYYYIGFSLFGIGTIIYIIYADALIKKYINEVEYYERVADRTFVGDLRMMLSSIEDNKKLMEDILETGSYNSAKSVIESAGADGEVPGYTKSYIMKCYYNLNDKKYSLARFFVSLFYAMGSIILLIPSIKTFVRAGTIVFFSIKSFWG